MCITDHNDMTLAIKVALNPNTTNHLQPLTTLKKKAQENTVGKGENAGKQHFLLFPQCFLHYQGEKLSLKQPLICHLKMLSIWSHPKFCRLVKIKTNLYMCQDVDRFKD